LLGGSNFPWGQETPNKAAKTKKENKPNDAKKKGNLASVVRGKQRATTREKKKEDTYPTLKRKKQETKLCQQEGGKILALRGKEKKAKRRKGIQKTIEGSPEKKKPFWS